MDQAANAVRAPLDAAKAVAVFNTASWPRTDLVVLDATWTAKGARVLNAEGVPVPSQVLSTGELAFLAMNVPPMSGAKYFVEPGEATPPPQAVSIEENRLDNDLVSATIDPASGAVSALRLAGLDANLADQTKGPGLNDYLYVAGRNPENPLRNSPPRISVKESGPLLASLLIESDAPGCNKLTREVRVIAGLDYAFLENTLDKANIYDKEAVHIAFPFHAPEGVVRFDIPFAAVRPEEDQMPGACKNYFTVQRWADVSNEAFGATLAVVDAPLMQVGAIANDPTVTGWIERLAPSATLIAYVMNNYWETNYKASQEGIVVFRYALRPHLGGYNPVEAQRFGVGQSQPLIVVPVDAETVLPTSRLTLTADSVIAVAFKPEDNGPADILRLFNVSDQPCETHLQWNAPKPSRVEVSTLSEMPGTLLEGPVKLAPYELMTLRAVY